MDKKTATDSRNYELNGSQLSLCDAKVELKEGDTQVKISKVSGVLTGSNTITIDNKVRDAFGNKVEDDTRIAFTAEKDNVKDRKSTRLNSSHANISYAVFCLKKKKT